MSRKRVAMKPYHAIYRDGQVVDVGEGDYSLQPGQTSLEFDSKRDRSLHEDVARWEMRKAVTAMEAAVQSMKSSGAYANKYNEAKELTRHVINGVFVTAYVYLPGDFPYLEIDVARRGITPIEAAQAVIAAVNRPDANDKGTWSQEDERVALREYVKQTKQNLGL